MNQDISNKLIEIADKLGVTVTEAWPIYVDYLHKQALIVFFSVTGLFLISLIPLVYVFKKKEKLYDDGPLIFCGIISGTLLLICTIVAGEMLPKILNPEGAVIHMLLK